MELTFTVSHVNDGPAPFDVVGYTDDGTELRIRFQDNDPRVSEGAAITVAFDQEPEPEG